MGRRIKSNKEWEILKECLNNNEIKQFPRIHKNAITSVNLICNEKYVMTTGEDGQVILLNFKTQRLKDKFDLNLERVMSTSVFRDVAVIGGRGGFEFFYLKPFKYVNYRDPNKNRFDKLISSFRSRKEEDKRAPKFPFKCNVIRALCFGVDEKNRNVLIFAGSDCNVVSKIQFKGPFEFLQNKLDESRTKRRSSIFSTSNFLNPNKSNKSISGESASQNPKRLSFHQMFSFNQSDKEIKRVEKCELTGRKTIT